MICTQRKSSNLAIKPLAFDDISLSPFFKNKISTSIKSQAHQISSEEISQLYNRISEGLF